MFNLITETSLIFMIKLNKFPLQKWLLLNREIVDVK